jgi:hypothetical protein
LKDVEETVIALFNALSQYLLGRTEENQESLSQDTQSRGRDFNSGPFEFEATMGRHVSRCMFEIVWFSFSVTRNGGRFPEISYTED